MDIKLPDRCPHERFNDAHVLSMCIPGYTYLAQVGDRLKIGYTANKPSRRMASITAEQGVRAIPIVIFRSHCARGFEVDLQSAFLAKKVYRISSQSDYFYLTSDDVAAIKAITHYGGRDVANVKLPAPIDEREMKERKHRAITVRKIIIKADCGHQVTVRNKDAKDLTPNAVLYAIALRFGARCYKCQSLVYPVKLLSDPRG